MCEHLDKAKAALDAARLEERMVNPRRLAQLLDIAHVQAAISQAESLARIAAALEKIDGRIPYKVFIP